MPRPKKTEAEIQSMRMKIVDTAMDILQENGPDAITSRAIADRLNVAHMSLFTYFKNKAAIMSALRERVASEWQKPLDEIEKRSQTEPILPLVQAFLAYFLTFAQENPRMYQMAWVRPEENREVLEHKRELRLEIVNHLARLLNLGMEREELSTRDPYLAASTVLGMANMPYILFHSGKIEDPNFRDGMVKEALLAVELYLK
jgi:AcrR family transcriptional regulator